VAAQSKLLQYIYVYICIYRVSPPTPPPGGGGGGQDTHDTPPPPRLHTVCLITKPISHHTHRPSASRSATHSFFYVLSLSAPPRAAGPSPPSGRSRRALSSFRASPGTTPVSRRPVPQTTVVLPTDPRSDRYTEEACPSAQALTLQPKRMPLHTPGGGSGHA